MLTGLFVACGGNGGQDTEAAAGASTSEVLHFEKDFPFTPLTESISHTMSDPISQDGVTVTPSVTIGGSFGLSDSGVLVKADYTSSPPRIVRLELSTRGKWDASARLDLDLKVDGRWKEDADFRKSFLSNTPLGGDAWELLKVPLLVIPMPQAPTLQVQVVFELAASCELDFDAELHASTELGVGGIANAKVFYDVNVPERVGLVTNEGLSRGDEFHVTKAAKLTFKDGNVAQAHGRCGLQASMNGLAALAIDPTHPFADVGVKVIVEPYAEFSGTFHSTSDWIFETRTALKGSISPFGDFFGHSAKETDYLTLFDYDLARGPSASSDPK